MRRIVIDANLLVLLVVGITDRVLISRHKRTRSFEVEDYDLLVSILDSYDQVVVTPHIMTEVSNLLSQIGDPNLTRVRQTLCQLLPDQAEEYEPSSSIGKHKLFLRLGITDCAILNLVSKDTPLITVDLDLYLSAAEGAAVNFNYLRQGRLLRK